MADLLCTDLHDLDLTEPIGRGPASRVWEAKDRRTGRRLALKVLTARSAREAHYQRAFIDSGLRLAALRHPGVVEVHSLGLVPEDAALRAIDMPEGAPWLAMPRADSTLASMLTENRIQRWATLARLLRQALDALCHAHACDLLHLDLKPSNLLVPGAAVAGDESVVLSDWTVARPRPGTGLSARVAILGGTPGRMPPEQVDGLWRRFGPWTDLYALGVLGWELSTGMLPFPGENRRAILYNQIQRGPVGFQPRFEVPDGFEAWLRVLMAPDPDLRFPCAADAARSLEGLAIEPGQGPVSIGELDVPTAKLAQHAPGLLLAGRPPPDPRLPATRPTPVQRLLWARLGSVHRTGQARAVLVQGRGNERMVAAWLSLWARKTGLVVDEVRARCGSGPAPARGIGPALARALGCVDLSRSEAEIFLLRRLRAFGLDPPWLARALAEESGPAERAEAWHSTSPAVLAARVLGALGQHRPVLLWLEDAPCDLEALGVARHLLLRREVDPSRLLILLTARQEDIEARPDAIAALRSLQALDGFEAAPSGPGGSRPIQGWLPLTGRDSPIQVASELGAVLGTVIEERSWVEISGDDAWAASTALVQTGEAEALPLREGIGWRLRSPETRQALLEHSASRGRRKALHRQAADQLERALHPDPPTLQDAAWHRLQAGDAGAAWMAASAATRLWQRRGRPWRAREALRLAEAALHQAGAGRGRRQAELSALLAEIELELGRPGLARSLALQLLEDAEPRWPDLVACAARLAGEAAAHLSQPDEAHTHLELARALALQHGLPLTFAQASLSLARLLDQRGQSQRALPIAREVLALPPLEEDPLLPSRARLLLAALARTAGDLVEAGAQLRQVLREAEPDLELLARARCEQGRLHRLRGRLPEARRHLLLALDIARQAGDPEILSEVWSELGRLVHAEGQPDEALRCQARARAWERTRALDLGDIEDERLDDDPTEDAPR